LPYRAALFQTIRLQTNSRGFLDLSNCEIRIKHGDLKGLNP